jgi:hypothetical protein
MWLPIFQTYFEGAGVHESSIRQGRKVSSAAVLECGAEPQERRWRRGLATDVSDTRVRARWG